jgi:hypothetical protein
MNREINSGFIHERETSTFKLHPSLVEFLLPSSNNRIPNQIYDHEKKMNFQKDCLFTQSARCTFVGQTGILPAAPESRRVQIIALKSMPDE